MVSDLEKTEALLETRLPLPRVAVGKVRDIYGVGSDKLLIVTTDRLSAFDVVLPNPIPMKGKVLNQITLFWLEHFKDLLPQHLITSDVDAMGLPKEVLNRYRHELAGRSVLVKKAEPLAIECVVRGYITGSGWKDYLTTGAVCGHKLPSGMEQCQKFPEPIFTPSTKAKTGHDINIDFSEAIRIVGKDIAQQAKELSILLYKKGQEYAAKKGIIIADTKFEFGIHDGKLMLIDEILTPDSSRFWPADRYETGHDQPSFDKQIVRNYLETLGWNKRPPAPELPADIIEKTTAAYCEIYKRLSGKDVQNQK
ncbi:MAG TPA: phosphoribosylaminoimidazolesuccinocarboxamide synthase [Candidatus Omnitrophota bacterium]|nr:phosphoribosylaminoimidazolesuccinocarboxamide synthase [Candidatus Omnitrophota bacterium]HRY85615.1 phosphoribosylaminoimidazolesuccinocarboxamide synthase [Candidatus Omnitrophota bacterium]